MDFKGTTELSRSLNRDLVRERNQTLTKEQFMGSSNAQFETWKVDHAALRVPDYDAAISWYTEKLNFKLRKQVSLAGLTFAFLSPAGDDDFVFELLAGPGADVRPAYPDLHSSYKAGGWHHVCFRVSHMDAAIEELKRRSVTIVSEPHDVLAMGLRLAFFADPWGNYFELTQLIGNQS